jgi:membrane protease YdiL (CAAX protease family)
MPLAARLAIGPLAGAAAFALLTGGRIPRPHAPPRVGRLGSRWLSLAVAAAAEEAIWRGLALGQLRPVTGAAAALAISAAGFALWHVRSVGRRCWVHLVTGSAFGIAFLAGGLPAAVVSHWLYNALVDWAVQAERLRVRAP